MTSFGCPICSESLSKLPAEAAQKNDAQYSSIDELNISAAPCGHMFHSYCIQKWLSGTLLSSTKCPCCRKDIPMRVCIPLYPTGYDNTILDDSVGDNNCGHEAELRNLRSRNAATESQLNDLTLRHNLLTKDFDELNKKLKQDIKREQSITERWMMKAKQYESYKDMVGMKEQEMKEIQNKLNDYIKFDMIVKGHHDDIECDRISYPTEDQSIDRLLNMKVLLTNELKRTAGKLNDSIRDKDQHLKDNNNLRRQLQHLKKKNKEIETVLANASCINNQPTNDCPKSPVSNETTRKKFFSKRKVPSPETSFSGEIIDSDVDIIECGFQPNKKSSKTKPPRKPHDATILISSDTDDDFTSPFDFRVKSNGVGVPPITPHASKTNPSKQKYSTSNNFRFAKPKRLLNK